jgi:hypothetical protein
MKRFAEGAQAAFTEQAREVPALILETFVLHAEQTGQRQWH